jgi:hypothetical protein
MRVTESEMPSATKQLPEVEISRGKIAELSAVFNSQASVKLTDPEGTPVGVAVSLPTYQSMCAIMEFVASEKDRPLLLDFLYEDTSQRPTRRCYL